jgi:tRNA modification GTPase
VAGVLEALGEIDGCRLAEPGEFTRRAFENGQLDLTAVEGLADLIAAETPAQRRQAFRQLKGLIGDRAEDWRRRLIEALALVEARIDFSDEADVPEDLITPALHAARQLRDEIVAVLVDGGRGERLRDGLVVAIAGPPNAGKSTLLNRLARREAAIVSPYPGTTRDVIEVHFNLGGYPVTLLDTAGIRESDDPLEQEGVRRARARSGAADLVLWVTDLSASGVSAGGLDAEVTNRDSDFGAVWQVRNKVDLVMGTLDLRSESKSITGVDQSFTISAGAGTGLNTLITALADHAEAYFTSGEAVFVTRQRHRQALEQTVAALDRALAHGGGDQEELIAEEMRAAGAALGRLTGRVDVEDVLDVIFRDFCIGK